MKNIIIVSLVIMVLCSGCSPDAFVDVCTAEAARPLQKIEAENFFKKVIPNKKYDYWALMEGKNVIYNQGDVRRGFIVKAGRAGADFDPFYGHYIFAVADNKSYYFYNATQFAEFLGEINNLDEALILAACYGFKPDSKLHADTFIHKGDTYVLRLKDNNVVSYYGDEVVDVTVTKDGFIKMRSVWQSKRLSN